MPPEPPGGTRPAGPVVLRIKLRYDDVDAMVSRFAPNVGKSGLFLPTKSLQPVGSEIKFELRLSNDTTVLMGLGRVKATKPPDPDNPKASFGMAIELMRVTRESRDLILRMLDRRRQLGLPDVTLPLPADIDAARRSDFVETAIKDPASAPIPVTTPIETPSESLLTAPRRQSGPLAVAKAIEIEALPPEPPRKKRPGLQELIDRASGPVAAVSVPGLDEDVDVAAVIARARALAGGDLDSELEALRESAAAPIEIDVEAASAELARQLGGVAVRRGQSAPTSWAPPPEIAAKVERAVEEKLEDKVAAPVEEKLEAKVEPPVVAPTEELAPVAQLVDEAIEAKAPVAPEPVDTTVEPPHEAATRIGEHVPLDFDTQTPVPVEEPGDESEPEEHEVEPDQIDDEIHQLGESDFEEVEHTQIGAVASAFEEHVFATTPAMQAELENQLENQLAEAEQESEHDDLGIGEASGHYLRSRIGLPPAEIVDEVPAAAEKREVTPLPAEYQQDFIHRFDEQEDPQVLEAPAFPPESIDGYGHTGDGEQPLEAEPEDIQEIDDFEILAEADEEDADLLHSSGEGDASAHHVVPPDLDGEVAADGEFTLPPESQELELPPPRESDFAMRLDLGDDDELPSAAPQGRMDLAASAGNALAGFDDEDNFDEPHAQFAPATGFTPPGRFDQSDVIPLAPAVQVRTKRGTAARDEDERIRPPRPLTAPPPRDINWDEHGGARSQWTTKAPPAPPSDEIDLESALEALDVDLDDLGNANAPHTAPTELPRSGAAQRATIRPPSEHQISSDKRRSGRVPRGRAPRASTEDGVLIDFDDDDE